MWPASSLHPATSRHLSAWWPHRPTPCSHPPRPRYQPACPLLVLGHHVPMIPTGHGPRLPSRRRLIPSDWLSTPPRWLQHSICTEFLRSLNPANPLIGGHEKPRAVCWNHRVLGAGEACCSEVGHAGREQREGQAGRSRGRLSRCSASRWKQRCPPPPCLITLCVAFFVPAPHTLRSQAQAHPAVTAEAHPRRADSQFSRPPDRLRGRGHLESRPACF